MMRGRSATTTMTTAAAAVAVAVAVAASALAPPPSSAFPPFAAAFGTAMMTTTRTPSSPVAAAFAFGPPSPVVVGPTFVDLAARRPRRRSRATATATTTAAGRRSFASLAASAAGGGGGGDGGGKKKKKRRRRRKTTKPPSSSSSSSATTTTIASSDATTTTPASIDYSELKSDDAVVMGIEDDETKSSLGDGVGDGVGDGSSLNLPDIKETIRKKKAKEEEEEAKKAREETEATNARGGAARKELIKRSDVEAFTKLLEAEPFADADDSYFQQEEYGTVSALLGEGAQPFLSIPPGPLQVGHFIGAFVIILMAFVEYPGFPLTNLPTPLRDCFQGGLATVYAINLVLAILATFRASERGQSPFLWAAKTFSVGGLAYDQLTQLPTLEEVETAKGRKGKRALKK